jgi:signal transduction histidine kinase/CheY-like chemotaxis protein
MAKHGLRKETLEGNNLFDFAHVENFQLLLDFFKKALKGERASREFKAKDEHYLIQVMPLKNEYNKIFAGLAIITNITQSKRIQEDLTRAKNLAIEASEAKTSFLANMSHEIRTPLTAIIGFSEQLEKTNLDDNQRQFNNYIRNSSHHLFGLVNDILILSKLGIGKLNISKKPFNIRNTIEDVYHSQLFTADQKNINFTIGINDKVANRLLGDSIRIKQVLINLTNNAIKFTKKGKVEMNCKVLEESDESQTLQFQVIDTGIGIPAQKQDEIFSEFTQVDSSINRKYGGSGLGLTICKKLSDLMDGTIDFESHPGKGTTFNFTLNLEKVQHEDITDDGMDNIDISKKIPAELEVLLVDDDEMNRALGEIILTKFNIKITTALNGRQALEITSKRKFDLVLLDIQMPEISGLDVTREIRSNREGLNKNTPIIAVTANSLQSEVVKYFKAGMNDYLLKPFHEKELLEKIMSALNMNKEINIAKKEFNNGSAGQGEKPPLFSLKNLEQDTFGNEEIKKKMLSLFIQNAKEHNKNLRSSLEEKNYKKLGEICHKMLPSYKHMEAMSIVDRLTHVEESALRDGSYDGIEETVEEIIARNKILIDELEGI